jgi:hypothetical protein
MPWYAAFGNHDAQVQGNVNINALDPIQEEYLNGIAIGTKKLANVGGMPDRMPTSWYSGIVTGLIKIFNGDFAFHYYPKVTADPKRRLLSKSQFIGEHFRTTGAPVGHGFIKDRSGGFYAVPAEDDDLFKFICLDTVDDVSFGADGIIDNTQFNWLERRLKENCSRYRKADGSGWEQQPNVRDKFIVIFCHHTLATMTHGGDGKKGPAVEKLLLRFPNVIMMVNGHTHSNNIWPHTTTANGVTSGFWEINTASHIDWPVQSRIIEVSEDDGTLSIFTTMVDADAPLRYTGDISTATALATLGRELAINDPQEVDRGIELRRGSKPDGHGGHIITDEGRNTQLLLNSPFPLS